VVAHRYQRHDSATTDTACANGDKTTQGAQSPTRQVHASAEPASSHTDMRCARPGSTAVHRSTQRPQARHPTREDHRPNTVAAPAAARGRSEAQRKHIFPCKPRGSSGRKAARRTQARLPPRHSRREVIVRPAQCADEVATVPSVCGATASVVCAHATSNAVLPSNVVSTVRYCRQADPLCPQFGIRHFHRFIGE
jgi:hypothetical protein